MKKRVKIIAAIAAALLAAGAAGYTAVQPLAVEARAVEAQTVSLTFTETGSYTYTRLYEVYPLVAGEIVELAVEEGARIAAGEVIAVVNTSDFEHQIAQLGSTIAGYNGQISNLYLQEEQEKAGLSATLQSLEGQRVVLEAEMAKNESLTRSLEEQIRIQDRLVSISANNVTEARRYLREVQDYGDDYEIIQARQALNNAQAALTQNELLLEQLIEGDVPEDIYEGQIGAIEAQIEVIEGQMEQSYMGGLAQYYNANIQAAQQSIAQMQEKAGQAAVTAPVGGVLWQLPAKDQNLLSQAAPVAVIADAPYVEVYVPVREIDGVAVGDAVELILDKRLGSDTLKGAVFDIADEAEARLSALGVEERRVRVLIRPAGGNLQIGYGMDVRFSPYTFEQVLAVPKTAVFEQGDTHFVWVFGADGLLEIREIERGVETRDGYLVDAGLDEGDVVVTDANDESLREGKRAVAA